MQVQFEYQLTNMPTACFDAAVRQHQIVDVPYHPEEGVHVRMFFDADNFADAMEVRSKLDEHGRFCAMTRYIRVPVELPITEWGDRQLNEAMWAIEDAQDEDVGEAEDAHWHNMHAELFRRYPHGQHA